MMRIGNRNSWRASSLFGLMLAAGIATMAVPAHAQSFGGGVEAAVKSASRSDRDLRVFYAGRGNRPLWFDGSGSAPAGEELLRLIETAYLDGLDPDQFDAEAVGAALERSGGGSPRALAKAEIALSRAFVRYASASRRPRDVGTVYLAAELKPTPPSSKALLDAAAAAPSLRNHISGMGWMNPVYADLREGFAASRGEGASGPRTPVPAWTTLRAGSNGTAVWALRDRLGLDPEGGYDRPVAAAVAEFQAARGLPVDGVAGPLTLRALNEAPQDRSRLIQTNLERARVLPTDPGRRYILVDAAGARLWMYENGRVQDSMKVIVGKASEQTPMLSGLIHYALVNPYWNVPPDLARTRVAPDVLKKGVRYLKTMRYEVLSDWTDKATVLDPKTVDWRAVVAGRQEVRIRQLPGKDNSMGKMKFVLPNDMGIYLHDTPDKHLFAQADRHLSAGCVRVEDAQRLAKWMFGKPLVATSKEPEQRVDLAQPIPVYMTYLTAAPAANGLVFRSDPYGRDQPGWNRRSAQVAGAR